MIRVAYLVHNLADAAVARRVTMLRSAGADVIVLGFCRDAAPPKDVAGAAAISLGRTHDAELGQRARQVLANLARPAILLGGCRGADVIVARNLEMLALGRWASARTGGTRLVYESLDIHRSLLGTGIRARAMRTAERLLMRGCSLLLTSSPAFLRGYFEPLQHLSMPSLLTENKVLGLPNDTGERPGPALPGPPWIIGWFGNLRCRKTLAALTALAERGAGRIEIVIAGKASPAEFPDFAQQVARPHVRYLGPYRASDLPGLYRQCHFAWAIDYFEEGLNSAWLLPNRLYEAPVYGAVPIALAEVETGRWLAARGAGLLLDGAGGGEAGQLFDALSALGPAEYDALRARVCAIPREDLVAGPGDCARLLAAIAG